MQLIPATTEKLYIPSTEYFKKPLSVIGRLEFKSEHPVILRRGSSAYTSISEFYRTEESPGTSIILLPQKLIRELENLYIFDNPQEIQRFLLTNEYLIEILFEAPVHIYRIFGHVPIHLELHHDPEESWDELFIVINSPYCAEEAIRLENKLTEEWFLDRMEETKGKLNITEEPL
jgi:hypothetical protein